MFRNLWNDEAGAVVCIEYILIGTICGIGVITGLSSLREGVITELADLGGAVAALSQAYVIGGSTSHCAAVAGSEFNDFVDFCDNATVGQNSRCLVVCGGVLQGDLPRGESAGTGS